MNKLIAISTALLFAAATAAPSVAFADNGKAKGYGHPSENGHGVNDSKHGGKHLDKQVKQGNRDRRDDHHDHAYDDNDRNDRDDRHDNRYYAKKRFRNTITYVAPRGYRPARYTIGNRLPAGYYDQNYYVNYNNYQLSAPPQGYKWVRVGNDVYMVQTRDGMVRDIIYSLFY